MERVVPIVGAGASAVAALEAGMNLTSAVFFAMSFGLSIWVGFRNVQIDNERREAQKERNFHYWKAQDAMFRLSRNGALLASIQNSGVLPAEAVALLNKGAAENNGAIAEWGRQNPMPPMPDNEGPYVSGPTK